MKPSIPRAHPQVSINWKDPINVDLTRLSQSIVVSPSLSKVDEVSSISVRKATRRSIVIAGRMTIAGGINHPFRWTEAGGYEDLGELSVNGNGSASSISENGDIVVGTTNFNAANMAFMWDKTNGITALGYLPGGSASVSNSISSNGLTIVGQSTVGGVGLPFVWTQAGGMVEVPALPGSTSGVANDVSSDGSIICGFSFTTQNHAWIWTQAGGTVEIGALPGDDSSYANGISGDGLTVVGRSRNTTTGNERPFKWTAGGMVELGLLPTGLYGEAHGVSQDGSVVIGNSDIGNGNIDRAVAWLSNTTAVNLGIIPPEVVDSNYSYAWGVSLDGTVVVGDSEEVGTEAFWWSRDVGLVGMGFPVGGTLSEASAITIL